jgi:acetolactate synthase-1/2/3 large subunit
VASVPHLVDLAERFNLSIFDGRASYMNFPHHHRLHQPILPGSHLQKADVILTLESDWPWAPGASEPHPDATVISVGSDALFSRYPLRSFHPTSRFPVRLPRLYRRWCRHCGAKR